MRLRAMAAAAAVILAAAGATACGSASPGAEPSPGGTPSSAVPGTSTAPSSAGGASDTASKESAAPAGPQIPPDTSVAAPVNRDLMPQASGSFGDKPTVTVPATKPPDSLQRLVLDQGDGTVSKPGDTVVVNYLGQVWGGEVFDNSYDRGAPFTVQVGSDRPQVVAGWNVGLVGVAQGSRLILTLPPRDGYGTQGKPPEIRGTDTLIFVIDVVGVYPPDAAGQTDATPHTIPPGWPQVGGTLGQPPTVTVPTDLPDPSQPGVTVVAEGHGPPAKAGTVLVQYVASSWDGSHVEQSWPDPTGQDPYAGGGPQAFPLSTSSPFAALMGVPIGSRVLMRTPDDSKTGIPASAWVIDLITQLDVTGDGAQSAGPSAQGGG